MLALESHVEKNRVSTPRAHGGWACQAEGSASLGEDWLWEEDRLFPSSAVCISCSRATWGFISP